MYVINSNKQLFTNANPAPFLIPIAMMSQSLWRKHENMRSGIRAKHRFVATFGCLGNQLSPGLPGLGRVVTSHLVRPLSCRAGCHGNVWEERCHGDSFHLGDAVSALKLWKVLFLRIFFNINIFAAWIAKLSAIKRFWDFYILFIVF